MRSFYQQGDPVRLIMEYRQLIMSGRAYKSISKQSVAF
jgi:hypothetical protein